MATRGTTSMDRELPVRLRDDEIIARAETLSAKLVHIGTLRKKRREDLRSMNALIESEIDEVERLARTIAASQELRKQGDLFVDQMPRDDAAKMDAAEVLAEVAIISDGTPAKYHGDGGLCTKDPCRRRRHLTLEQCKANGVVVEGEPIMDGARAQAPTCDGCGETLTATEIVKRLGLCEACQTQSHEASDEGQPEDDPRPRCATCKSVLNADEVAAGLGLCSSCECAAAGGVEPGEEDELDTGGEGALS